MSDNIIKVSELKPHPIADIFPMLPENSIGFQATLEDIKANGLKQPIWLYEGQVLEGRHRVRILQLLGVDELRSYIGYMQYEDKDPVGFVLSMNLHRRHLNESQRAMVAAKLANLGVGANQHTKLGTSIDAASKLLNVGRASIDRAKVVLKADPWLIKAVENGDTSVSSAANQAKQQEQPPQDPPTQDPPVTPAKKGKGKGKEKKPKNQTVINEDVQPTHSNYLARLGLMIEALREWPKGNLSLMEEWADEARQRIDNTIEQLVGQEGEQRQAAE